MKQSQLIIAILFIFSMATFGQTDGTTGIPLGGIGTGAIKYKASTGTFSHNFRTPTRDGNYQSLPQARFQLYTKRGSTIETDDLLKAAQVSGRVDDDAVFPLHKVNFGELNNVSVKLNAYLPYDPTSVNMMCHPAVLFEFSVENLNISEVTVALAFQLNASVAPVAITDTGFFVSSTSLQLALAGSSGDGSGQLTYGSDDGFFTTGLCNNLLSTGTNRLAISVDLGANESKKVQFVLSWYQPDEPEHYFYTNLWDNAKDVAISALEKFESFKNNAEELVNRMRASNLPDWLVDQTLNTTSVLINNSIYFQDGRYCHSEGQWEPEGTMDQMWHSRQIYTMIIPELAWMELEWWARTQHVLNYQGQIHHDFGTDFNYVEWDDTEHSDYRDIHKWVDLNCGFIISVYETFIATADEDKLSFFWPYVKKAAQRILDQVDQFGSSEYPNTFEDAESTYDAGGNSQAYNSGLSIATYQLMVYMAEIMGEPGLADIYNNALETASNSFEERWLDKPYPQASYCESVLGVPWIANFFKLDPYWAKQKLDNLFFTILNYYNPLENGMGLPGGSYSEWQPYLVAHFGGYSLQSGRPEVWHSLQKDMYDRNYLNRNLVFNHQLGIPPKVSSPTWIASNLDGSDHYISIPVLWRNYYTIAGYHYNKYSGELWLEPVLFDELDNILDSALIITPDGYVNIHAENYGDEYQNQLIRFKPEQPVEVSSLYVWDKYSDTLDAISLVQVNGIDVNFERISNGDQTRLKLDWADTVSEEGITVRVEGIAKAISVGTKPDAPETLQALALSPSQIQLTWNALEEEVLGYILEIEKDGNFTTLITTGPNDTSYIETGLLPSTDYTYRLLAYNSAGISDPGIEVNSKTLQVALGKVIVALNAGGNTYQSNSGIEYIYDVTSGWVSGGRTYSNSNPISGTEDDVLYRTERFGDFSYSIPIDNGIIYYLVLKFAEIYHDDPKSRIFNVDIEGEQVISNMDIAFRAGKNVAYDVVIPIQIQDGNLDIEFTTISENAKISGLEIREEFNVGIHPPVQDRVFEYNFLNPVDTETTIKYSLNQPGHITFSLLDVNGHEINRLVDEKKQQGNYDQLLDITYLNSGIYYLRLQLDDYYETKKLIVIR